MQRADSRFFRLARLGNGLCGGSRQRDSLSCFLYVGSVSAIVCGRSDGSAGRSQIVARRRRRRLLRRGRRAVSTWILFLAGLRARRKRLAAGPTRCIGFDFSYGLFERQPLAGNVRLTQRRLDAPQLRKERGTRPII
jgi:hypothetical protein